MSKERLTIALCASVMGEKLTPLIIGKSAKPRCFKNISIKSITLTYLSNKKAWMTSYIFDNWLRTFNDKMRREERNVLLFLDNAPSHPHISLSNIKLQFFPPNTTSCTQPMDQGIIQTVKLKFRTRQLQYVLNSMDKDKTKSGPEILRQIYVLDTIYWIDTAWNAVEAETIKKCFNKSVFFLPPEPEADSDELNIVDEYTFSLIPLRTSNICNELFDCEFRDLVVIDDELATTDLDGANITTVSEPDSSDDENNDEIEPEKEIISIFRAQSGLCDVKKFMMQMDRTELLKSVMELEEGLELMHQNTSKKQTLIDDFLVSKFWFPPTPTYSLFRFLLQILLLLAP